MSRIFAFLFLAACGNDISLVPTNETDAVSTVDTQTVDTHTTPSDDTDTVPTEDTGTVIDETGNDPCAVTEGRWYDRDGDGFGNPDDSVRVSVCEPLADNQTHAILGREDCDDTDPDTNPEAAPNEAELGCYNDDDGDDWGDDGHFLDLTVSVDLGTDCDDGWPHNNPGQTEHACDDADNNCDGQVDEGFTLTPWYFDADNDTFGFDDVNATSWTCDNVTPPGPQYVLNADDCDDVDPETNPSGTEVCGDGVDQDCDGSDLACPQACDFVHTYWYNTPGGAVEAEYHTTSNVTLNALTASPLSVSITDPASISFELIADPCGAGLVERVAAYVYDSGSTVWFDDVFTNGVPANLVDGHGTDFGDDAPTGTWDGTETDLMNVSYVWWLNQNIAAGSSNSYTFNFDGMDNVPVGEYLIVSIYVYTQDVATGQDLPLLWFHTTVDAVN